MQGMFRANGGCGYVKKPDFMLRNEPFGPKIRTPVKKILTVIHLKFPKKIRIINFY